MKNYKIIIVISIFFFSFVQTNEKEIKYWSSSSLLTWTDFKGKADNNSRGGASSDCQITSKMKGKKDSVLFTVESYFNIATSWVKEEEKSETLLKHEQGHFNINEIFARKLRKALKESKVYKATVPYFFKEMQSTYFSLVKKEQELYDNETEHSTKKEKQFEWDKKIDSQLKELESFSSSNVIVAYSK